MTTASAAVHWLLGKYGISLREELGDSQFTTLASTVVLYFPGGEVLEIRGVVSGEEVVDSFGNRGPAEEAGALEIRQVEV